MLYVLKVDGQPVQALRMSAEQAAIENAYHRDCGLPGQWRPFDGATIEHKVLAAFENEAETCTKAEIEACQHHVNAYRNAAIYADQWGLDVDRFRAAITSLANITEADCNKGLA